MAGDYHTLTSLDAASRLTEAGRARIAGALDRFLACRRVLSASGWEDSDREGSARLMQIASQARGRPYGGTD